MSSVLFGVSVLAVLVVSALIGAGLALYSGTDWSGIATRLRRFGRSEKHREVRRSGPSSGHASDAADAVTSFH